MNLIDLNARVEKGSDSLFPEALSKSAGSDSKPEGSFGSLLNGLVDQVDELQKSADTSIKGLVTGEETNIHNVAIKMEEASVAFDLMMQVRNKLLEAYQEISRMQS
ncbi:MAG: flagellar hook-basal body complex protein FliE [bacterium]